MLEPPTTSTGIPSSSSARQHTDVGHAAGAASAEHQPHRVAGEQAPDAGDVGGRARSHVVRSRRLDGSRPGTAHAAGNGRRAAEEHEVDGRGGEGVDTGPPAGDAVEPVRRRIRPTHEHDAIGLAEDRDRIGVGAIDRDDVHAGADRTRQLVEQPPSFGRLDHGIDGDDRRPARMGVDLQWRGEAGGQQASDARRDVRARHQRDEPLRRDAHQQRVTGDDSGPRPPATDEQ